MRRYYIDFETWEINATSEEEAEKKALALLKGGTVPEITGVDDTEEDEPLEEESVGIRVEDIVL